MRQPHETTPPEHTQIRSTLRRLATASRTLRGRAVPQTATRRRSPARVTIRWVSAMLVEPPQQTDSSRASCSKRSGQLSDRPDISFPGTVEASAHAAFASTTSKDGLPCHTPSS